MLGEFIDEYTVQVVDVFAMPQSGTGVSVEAVDPVFQTKMLDQLKQTNRPEMVVGWYHSHPGFGCWLSGVDISTQQVTPPPPTRAGPPIPCLPAPARAREGGRGGDSKRTTERQAPARRPFTHSDQPVPQSFEQLNKRAVSVVVDPIQSVKGKVVIDAFRLINPQLTMMGQAPRQTTSNLGALSLLPLPPSPSPACPFPHGRCRSALATADLGGFIRTPFLLSPRSPPEAVHPGPDPQPQPSLLLDQHQLHPE